MEISFMNRTKKLLSSFESVSREKKLKKTKNAMSALLIFTQSKGCPKNV